MTPEQLNELRDCFKELSVVEKLRAEQRNLEGPLISLSQTQIGTRSKLISVFVRIERLIRKI